MEKAVGSLLQLWIAKVFEQAYDIGDYALIKFSHGFEGGNGFAFIWNWVTNIANTIVEPIAVCIVVIFFILKLMDKVSTERLTMEAVIKDVIGMVLGLYLVTNSVEIVTDMLRLGNGLAKAAMDSATINDINYGSVEVLFSAIGDPNGTVWDKLVYLVGAKMTGPLPILLAAVVVIIVSLFFWVVMLIMKVCCLARTLEVAARTALSPIGLADTFNNDFINSRSLSFLKTFLALALQGVVIGLIANFLPLYLDGVFAGGQIYVWDLVGLFAKAIVITGACLVLMFKAGTIAKETVGVH